MTKYFIDIFPIENWLTEPVLDPDLRGPIDRARAEFKGKTDLEVKELWREFQSVLESCFKSTGRVLPTFKVPFSKSDSEPDRWIYGGGKDQETELTDFVKMFQTIIDLWKKTPDPFRPLSKFIFRLNRDADLAFCKTLALLILKESSNHNPQGVLKAAGLLMIFDSHLRPRIDEAAKLRLDRRKGGRKTAAKKQAKAQDR